MMLARIALALIALCLVAVCQPLYAQEPRAPDIGISSAGLCGLLHAASPRCAPGAVAAATARYGIFDPIGQVRGVHHQVSGSLAAAYAFERWFALGLRLDGRLDLHPDDGAGKDRTAAGDPRLFLRAGGALGGDVDLGGEVRIWVPGGEAPSFEARATTVDLKLLLSWLSQRTPWGLVANAGFRLDNSDETSPDLTRVRSGDRISLGLSEAHAVLVALGLTRQLGDFVLFGEVSADLLIGGRAPAVLESPMRVALGGRRFITDKLQLDVTLIASLSQQPSIATSAPLAPIEPRVMLAAGLRYGAVRRPSPKPAEVLPQAQPPVATELEPATHASVRGLMADAEGHPLPEVSVNIVAGDYARSTVTDASGRYEFADVPVGDATLEASAAGFARESWTIRVEPDAPQQPKRSLTPTTGTGILRSLVRSFTSEPLSAGIIVRDGRGRVVARGQSDEQGRYEIALEPGRYQVTISAPGYRRQQRGVRVSTNEVAILNVDMRKSQ